MRAPFRVRRKGAVLNLELDTPGSRVNILTPEACEQLEAVLAAVDPRKVRAVVIRSGKPHSFLNGARLLYAASVRTMKEAKAAAAEVRRTFTAVGACRVPTVAAIAGSCFGCGLELALWCDHRWASDGWDTEMYLTELVDYLLVPVFGSTARLPPLVGLEAAIDLVLWGRRMRAVEAHAVGLVDRVIRRDRFDEEVDRWARGIRGRAVKRRRTAPASERGARAEALSKIRALPKEARPAHRAALRLLELASFDGRSAGDARDRVELELDAFARTVTTEASARAVSYFFVRQTSDVVGAGGSGDVLSARFRIAFVPSGAAERLEAVLGARPIQGTAIGGGRTRIAVAVAPRAGGEADVLGPRTTLYFPFAPEEESAVELALAENEKKPPPGLMAYLGFAGYVPVVTHPVDGRAVSERLIAAYLRGAGANRSAERALARFGFARSPSSLGGGGQGRKAADAVGEVLAELLAESLRCLAEGALAHRAQADVLVRVLFGFPLHAGSLFQLLDRRPELARHAARKLGPKEQGARALLARSGQRIG